MIEILTFTGVDEKTDLQRMAELSRKYPKIEFGFLVGSKSRFDKSSGIWPSIFFVENMSVGCRKYDINTAIHLCGKYAREAITGFKGNNAPDLYPLLRHGFGRVQLNLPKNFWAIDDDDFMQYLESKSGRKLTPKESAVIEQRNRNIEYGAVVKALADALQISKNLILQHRSGWDEVPVKHPKVEYLFDVSGGRGIPSIGRWPEPASKDIRYGYAGGIGPHTISSAMLFANSYPEHRLWLDMESQIRTDGYMDLDIVEHICEVVFGE